MVRGNAASDSSVLHGSFIALRLEPSATDPDACVRSAPVTLAIGRTYQVDGWVRTDNLSVRDLGRSPIAVGAAISMASMPFDVHSASLGGTRPWTRVSLRFVASRASDRILLCVANGGGFTGKAWFAGVSLGEVPSDGGRPPRDAVRTFGPAYRYPRAGWIYLHIEGKPYERGYQHGFLMCREIPEYLARCAFMLAGRVNAQAWNTNRITADALFLRGFDSEVLEEMKGIADGANAAGARWLGRKIDLVDIVLANTTVELRELELAVIYTPKGIEGERLDAPPYASRQDEPKARPTDHCSAFAATGPATRDGRMVIGQVTWWPLTFAEQTNVMIDIRPENGHRLLMQSYPGGIESGTDWYQNDSGIVLTETTIEQTPFNARGTPVAFRAREAMQYSSSIDEVVSHLGTRNNGLYTNEWIIGDGKTDEIAMFELGTNHTRLWRSSRNEWFGNTPGFYWSDNNTKDLAVNLEHLPDPHGVPRYIPYAPKVRDVAWQGEYRGHKGQIDEQFAFRAFDAPPLISEATVDAKVVTSAMADHMMVWAELGRPNESARTAQPGDTIDKGLYPGGYALFCADAPESLKASVTEIEKGRRAPAKAEAQTVKSKPVSFAEREERLWRGWILPASDADTWFVAGSAAYREVLQAPDLERAMDEQRVRYRGLLLSPRRDEDRILMESTKGVLFLDALRRKMGDEAFLDLMDRFYAANAAKSVTAQAFLEAANAGFEVPDPGPGPAYIPADILDRLASAVIVYGTAGETGANRYAAEREQSLFREHGQFDVPICKDFEATAALLAHRDVVFVGRPETNSALADWKGPIGLDYEGAAFRLDGKVHASERDALVFSSRNPMDPSHMVLVYAGNSPLQTATSIEAPAEAPSVVLEDGIPVGPPAASNATPGR